MARRKQIKIHLLDGETDGLKTVDLSGWIGEALIIPRAKLGDTSQLENCEKPAVYFLFGKGKEAYIGEAENLKRRLDGHNRKPLFPWHTAIGFISQGKSITKVHAQYLESRCIEDAKQINHYTLKNESQPTLPQLPSSDIDDMEDFLEKLNLILTSIGYLILQPQDDGGEEQAKNQRLEDTDEKLTEVPDSKDEFICKGKNGALGRGYLTGNKTEFLVLKGSTARAEVTGSFTRRANEDKTSEIKEREKLIAGGQLKRMDDELYIFTEDYPFGSPYAAASAIRGARVTKGWKAWKYEKSGKTLSAIYRRKK